MELCLSEVEAVVEVVEEDSGEVEGGGEEEEEDIMMLVHQIESLVRGTLFCNLSYPFIVCFRTWCITSSV